MAWTSPERLRGSVFGYFVREGLQGVADDPDVSEWGDGDRRVSLQELYKYVRGRVDQWALLKGKKEPYTYLAAASEAWARCLKSSDLSPAKLTPLVDFVDAGSDRARAGPGVIEIHFLRMLRDYLDPAVRSEHSDLVRTALRTRDLAEKAAAPADERVLYAIQKRCEEADANRRRAEDGLFIGNEEALTDGGEGSVGSAGTMQTAGVTGEPESAASGTEAVDLTGWGACFGGLLGGTGSM